MNSIKGIKKGKTKLKSTKISKLF